MAFDLRSLLSPQNTTNSQGTTNNASNQSGLNNTSQFNQSNAWGTLQPFFGNYLNAATTGPQSPNQWQLGAAGTAAGIANTGVTNDQIGAFYNDPANYARKLEDAFRARNAQWDANDAGAAAKVGAITGSGFQNQRNLTHKAQQESQGPQLEQAYLGAQQNAQQMALANNQQKVGAAGLEGNIGNTIYSQAGPAWYSQMASGLNPFLGAAGQQQTGSNNFTGQTQGWGTNQNQTTQQRLPSWLDTAGQLGQFASMFAADGGRIRSNYADGGEVRGYWDGGATMGGWPTGGGDPFMPQGAPQQTPQFPQATPGGFNPMWGQQFAQQFGGGNRGFGGFGGWGFGGGQPRMPAWGGQFQAPPVQAQPAAAAAQPMKPALANPTAATGGLSPGLATAPQAAAVLGQMGGPGNWSYGASMAPSPAAQPAAVPQNAGATSTTGVVGAPMMAQPMAQPAAAAGMSGPSSSLGGWSYGGGNSMQAGGFASGGSVSMADKVGHAFKAFHKMKNEAKHGFADGGGLGDDFRPGIDLNLAGGGFEKTPENSWENKAWMTARPEMAAAAADHFNDHVIDSGPLKGQSRNAVMDKATFAAGAPWPTPQTTMPDQMPKPAMGPSSANGVSPFGATVQPGDFTTDTRPFGPLASGGSDNPADWDKIKAQAEANPNGSNWPTLGQIGAGLSKLGSPSETTNATGATAGASSAAGQSSDPTGMLAGQSRLAQMLAAYARPQAAEGGAIHGYDRGGDVTLDDGSLLSGPKEAPPAQPSGGIAGWLGSFLKPTGHYTKDANGIPNQASNLQNLAEFMQRAGGSDSAAKYYEDMAGRRKAEQDATRLHTTMMGQTPQGQPTLARQEALGNIDGQPTLAKLQQQQAAEMAAGQITLDGKRVPTLAQQTALEEQRQHDKPTYGVVGKDQYGIEQYGLIDTSKALPPRSGAAVAPGGSTASVAPAPSRVAGAPADRDPNAPMGSERNPIFVSGEADATPGTWYTTPTKLWPPVYRPLPGERPAQGAPPVQQGAAPAAPVTPNQRPHAVPPGAGASALPQGVITSGPIVANRGDTALTGEEFLKTLDATDARMVKQIAQGEIPFPTGMAAKTGRGAFIANAVVQYDPSFNTFDYMKRHQTVKSFAPGGKNADAVKSINTVIGHLGDMDKTIDELGNWNMWGGTPLRRWVGNPIAKLDPTVEGTFTRFAMDRNAVADELSRAFKGANISDTEVKEWKDKLDDAKSGYALKQGVQEGLKLLESRIRAVESDYRQGMGRAFDWDGALYPKSKQVLSRLRGENAEGGLTLARPIAEMGLEDLQKLPREQMSREQLQQASERYKALTTRTP